MSETKPVLAHTTRVRRVTLPALRRALRLTGHCEWCGASSGWKVAFMPTGGGIFEACAACLAEGNRRAD